MDSSKVDRAIGNAFLQLYKIVNFREPRTLSYIQSIREEWFELLVSIPNATL